MDTPMPPWIDDGAPADADHILAVLGGEHSPENVPAQERADGWSISTTSEAEWAMAQLAAAHAQRQAVLDQVALWQAKLDGFRRAGVAQPDRTIGFFHDKLERWGMLQRELDPRTKTIALASGSIATRRATAPVIVVEDAQRFIAWALNAYLPPVEVAVVDGEPIVEVPLRTFADVGCVKTTHEAMISEIRKLLSPAACPSCGGSGIHEEDHGQGNIEQLACPDCGGGGHVISALVLGLDGTPVVQWPPGLSIQLPVTTATPKPAPLGLGGAR